MNYICPNCGQKYYSASNQKENEPCEVCGAPVKAVNLAENECSCDKGTICPQDKNLPLKTQTQLLIYRACKKSDINNPVKRCELCEITGLSDRYVRDEIGKMRDLGIRICGTSHDAGYWIAKGQRDFEAFLKNYGSKAWTTMRRIHEMLNYTEGQIEL